MQKKNLVKNNNLYIQKGLEIHNFSRNLEKIYRSITGPGVRQSLKLIQEKCKKIKIKSIKSGTNVFDWKIPKEWVIKDAYILTPQKKKICNFKKNFLHVVGYSEPINKLVSLKELKKHLHTTKKRSGAIPYITSYYKKNWGFCISHKEFKKLKKGNYFVKIDSEFKKGELNYGELLIKGKSKKEIFISSYICHPNLANNEISGPALLTFIADSLLKMKNRRYSYRIVFVPETIGSISYLSKNYKEMKKKTIAGFNLTCIGDDRTYSYMPSRTGDNLSDRAAKHVLKFLYPNYKTYSWIERGSDERQYCSPGIDLPLCVLMRSKYGTYPEYHTSDDNLKNVVTPKGFSGSYKLMNLIIEVIENNFVPLATIKGEPFLSKRKFKFNKIESKTFNKVDHKFYQVTDAMNKQIDKQEVVFKRKLMHCFWWCDGKHDLIDIADKLNIPFWEVKEVFKELLRQKIIKKINI